ncbi:MAG: hypothetical protein A2077_03935 [Nitrospirae bacterium GWC2_46_6]|nr:MAG: hypothetical protein A2077_03935 [Nitrospirae bacterium GWC2_46_6]OGW21612.1 MAG: hypothetical protein A2Z82_04840 [Nitrospirae bacterium GWA2_46_11]OGW25232.1 MAG: hypothetical protein A2X55_08600 [Nitrospirae bacterium GWB2_47_37]HAK89079.1 hypothetical protein [Nitrospiraceae bacterium]HCL81382.1 hypothetical protein [Nitrospiraceae bacterium]
MHKTDMKNILVIRFNKAGDMICTIPLLKTLRRHFKDAAITLFAEDASEEISGNIPQIDGFFVYRKTDNMFRNKYVECRKLIKNYKKAHGIKKFDIAIAVKGGFSSFLSAAACISGAGIRIGYRSPQKRLWNLCYNLPANPIDLPSVHQVEACLNLLTAIGISDFIRDASISVPAAAADKAYVFLTAHKMTPKKRIAVFNISNNRESSTWYPENFIKLGRIISQKYGYNFIITSIPADKGKAVRICDQLNGKGFFYDTAGLMDFAAVASVSNFLVAGDGGAVHIGAAAGAKVIALFGQTNPIIYGPYGEGHIVLKSKDGNVNSITPDDVITALSIHE